MGPETGHVTPMRAAGRRRTQGRRARPTTEGECRISGRVPDQGASAGSGGEMTEPRNIAIAVTGAGGTPAARHVLSSLVRDDRVAHVDLMVSATGRKLIAHELGGPESGTPLSACWHQRMYSLRPARQQDVPARCPVRPGHIGGHQAEVGAALRPLMSEATRQEGSCADWPPNR
jgi:hypothetical protein